LPILLAGYRVNFRIQPGVYELGLEVGIPGAAVVLGGKIIALNVNRAAMVKVIGEFVGIFVTNL
jgi:hypothetical protein